MKKRIVLSFLIILWLGFLNAKPVLIDDAKQVALSFIAEKKQYSNSLFLLPTMSNLNIVYQKNEIINGNTRVSFYVFNNGANGFIIIAGDDDITPILGYSDNSTFAPNNIPPNVQYWLDSYSKQIKYVIENNIKPVLKVVNQWNKYKSPYLREQEDSSFVLPLLSTNWDQGQYYNALCPSGTPTGCVATAIAQIMKFWDFPQRGKGKNTYEHPIYGTLSANFQNQTYQWCKMPNRVTMPNLAVATLMYHCGVAVNMNYAPGGSGAYSGNAASALVSNFYYASSTHLVVRDYISEDDWIALIKNELNLGRPLYYAGNDNETGHAFVCDGYDGDYFHFNWGWSGYYDGYFKVDALNPIGQGTGGNQGGFNFNQEIIIGIEPNYNVQFTDIQMNSSISTNPNNFGKNEPFTVTAEIVNKGTNNFNGEISLALFNKNTNEFIGWLGDAENVSMAVSESKTVNFYSEGIAQNSSYYLRLYFTNNLFVTGNELIPDINTNLVGDNCNASFENNYQFVTGTYSFLQLTGNIDVYPARYNWLNSAPVDVNFNIKNKGTGEFNGTIKVVVTDINDSIKEIINEENISIGANNTKNVFISKDALETNQGNYYLKCYSKDRDEVEQVLFSQYDLYIKTNPQAKSLDNITILPNPAEDFIIINADKFSGTITEITLNSLTGQVILKDKIEKTQKEKTITLNYLNKGVYVLNIKTSEGTIKTKIIKK